MNKRIFLFSFLCMLFLNIDYAQTVSISGKVLRHNDVGLEGVLVTCTSGDSVLTGPEGDFIFTDLPEGVDYTIDGIFETEPFEDVTILDAVFIRHLILYIIQAPVSQWIAADMNESASVSAYDMIIQRWGTLHIEEYFPEVYWRFFNSELSNVTTETGIYLEDLQLDTAGLKLIAIKSGDVAFEEDHSPAPSSASNPEFYFLDKGALQDSMLFIDVKVRDFRQILGFQHNVNWDPDVIEYVSYENPGPYFIEVNDLILNQGILPVFGQDYNSVLYGENLEDDSTLYTLQFRALQDVASLESVLDFSESQIPHQAVYYEGMEIFVVDQTYYIEAQPNALPEISNLSLFNISPNPFWDEVVVNIRFENIENGKLELYDLNGRMINSMSISGDEIHESLYLHELESGTYFLKLRTDKGIATQKLVKL